AVHRQVDIGAPRVDDGDDLAGRRVVLEQLRRAGSNERPEGTPANVDRTDASSRPQRRERLHARARAAWLEPDDPTRGHPGTGPDEAVARSERTDRWDSYALDDRVLGGIDPGDPVRARGRPDAAGARGDRERGSPHAADLAERDRRRRSVRAWVDPGHR